jgi:hypothetical protein
VGESRGGGSGGRRGRRRRWERVEEATVAGESRGGGGGGRRGRRRRWERVEEAVAASREEVATATKRLQRQAIWWGVKAKVPYLLATQYRPSNTVSGPSAPIFSSPFLALYYWIIFLFLHITNALPRPMPYCLKGKTGVCCLIDLKTMLLPC